MLDYVCRHTFYFHRFLTQLPQYKTNVVGTMHVINAFLPLLLAARSSDPNVHPKVIALTSTLGSPKLSWQSNYGINVAYGASKAALNMIITKYGVRFREKGIIFLAVNPGLVKTLEARAFFVSRNKLDKLNG